MAFIEDNSAFLADFAVACVCNGVGFKALFDMPDDNFNLGVVSVQSREYRLTYANVDIILKSGYTVLINDANYTVRNSPNLKDDGVWAEAQLTKT